MKKIEAYAVGDKIFENEKDALDYEKSIQFTQRIEELVDKQLYNGCDKGDVVDFLIVNRVELKKIL